MTDKNDSKQSGDQPLMLTYAEVALLFRIALPETEYTALNDEEMEMLRVVCGRLPGKFAVSDTSTVEHTAEDEVKITNEGMVFKIKDIFAAMAREEILIVRNG